MEEKNFTPLPAEIISQIKPEMIVTKVFTEEEAGKYLGLGKGHGRIPTAIAKQIVAINSAKKVAVRIISNSVKISFHTDQRNRLFSSQK